MTPPTVVGQIGKVASVDFRVTARGNRADGPTDVAIKLSQGFMADGINVYHVPAVGTGKSGTFRLHVPDRPGKYQVQVAVVGRLNAPARLVSVVVEPARSNVPTVRLILGLGSILLIGGTLSLGSRRGVRRSRRAG